MGDVDARVHILYTQLLHKEEVGWIVLRSAAFYPLGKLPVLILREVEWTPGPVRTRRSEEKSPPGIEPGPSSP